MSFFGSFSNYANSISAFVSKNKLYTNEEIKALPKKRKSIKSATFSQALKVTPNATSVQDIFTIAAHAYSAFLYARSSVHEQLCNTICGPNHVYNDDWVECVGNYSALYGYINNKPFICCRFDEDDYSQQQIYTSVGKYYLYDSRYSPYVSPEDDPKNFIYEESLDNDRKTFEVSTVPTSGGYTCNFRAIKYLESSHWTPEIHSLYEEAMDCQNATAYLSKITSNKSKDGINLDSLSSRIKSVITSDNLFRVIIKDTEHPDNILSTEDDDKIIEIHYLYTSQEAYNKGQHPLIVHISDPNTTSQTFIQLSDENYIDCDAYGSETLISYSYNNILELLKKIKIPTELSEDVKSAIAGTYQIPDEIRKIYDKAVKEQRKFDSRANNPR